VKARKYAALPLLDLPRLNYKFHLAVNNTISRNIPRNDGVRADYAIVSDRYACAYENTRTEPNILPYANHCCPR